ncbi:thiol:disulfide interchange protein DsbA/DsbL [Alcaligenaceae bacterium]|nr:thiol:disulfide interchange protein DsbA/DsbL [Alcaligenaceae bacterium]
MSLKNFFVRSLALSAISVSALLAPAAQAHQDTDQAYVTLEKAQPSDTTGKQEVLEFFAYTCSHCNIMEPMVESWSKTLPEEFVLRRVPVAFNASMIDLQKLYYSLESMGRLDLHPKVFDTIHNKREKIYTAPVIFEWVAKQGVDRQEFEAVFNSFGIQSKVTRAADLAKTYQIEGTPSLAVGGQYVTAPSMTDGYEDTIVQAQKLVDKVLAK